MKNKRPGIVDIVESFLTGLSCLIGGDQFYIFISQTNASIKLQYSIFITMATATFIATFMLDHNNDILFNGSYLIYVILTGLLALISYNQVKSQIFISFITFLIAIVLTFFIIQACAKYSKQKFLLPSFIIGLFSARLVPKISWIFMKKHFDDSESQLHFVSLVVSVFRLSICLKVILINAITSKFELNYDIPTTKLCLLDNRGRIHGFSIFWDFNKRIRINLFPFSTFISSIVVYLTFPPTIHISYFTYSSQLLSSLSTVEMGLHILGLGVGVIQPFSHTGNYYHYYTIVFVIYLVYVGSLGITYHLGKFFNHYVLYFMIIISSFLLGYLCTYSLGILINTTFFQTCQHEEYEDRPCCGDKINNECYCKYPSIADSIKPKNGKRFACSELCIKSGDKVPSYGIDGKSAILIITDSSFKDSLSKCQTSCGSASGQCCQAGGQSCCLKLLGIFALDTVTTSSCSDCQLTVRLEARKVCSNKFCCASTGGHICTCSEDHSNCCCCLCIKCCSGSCKDDCICPKLCSCQKGSQCSCCNSLNDCIRIFLAYKNGSEKNCCIKEIKPSSNLDFIGDNKEHYFDIRDLFLSDCCHNKLFVDIYCTIKNNFYRLTAIDYLNKSNQPLSLKLSRKDGKCCQQTAQQQCCCAESQLVKVCLDYKSKANQEVAKTECSCGGSCKQACQCCHSTHVGKCCCCLTCSLNVDNLTSFYKFVDSARIKLICTSMFHIAFFSFLLVLIVFWIRSSNIEPYKFNPKMKLGTIKDVASSKKFNVDSEIENRLKLIADAQKTNHIKEGDLANMLTLFGKVMKKDHHESLLKYVDKKSDKFIKNSPIYKNINKPELVKWCYCTGLIHAYFLKLFAYIQKFFTYWERAWQNEFFDYRKLLSSIINNISQKSKFSLTVLTELNVTERSLYQIARDRSTTWNDVFGEIDRYTHLYEGELKFSTKWLPFRLDNRLGQYVERWLHRMDHIYEWTQEQKSVFDWKPFLYYFRLFQQWYNDFYPYLVLFSDKVTIPTKDLNKEAGVFVNYILK